MDWESILTILGICVAFGSPFVVNWMFSIPAKATQKQSDSYYVPHHIDANGDVVMSRKLDKTY